MADIGESFSWEQHGEMARAWPCGNLGTLALSRL